MTYDDLMENMVANNLSIVGLLKYSKNQQDKLFAMPGNIKEQYDSIYIKLKKDFENYKNTQKHTYTDQERGKMFERLIDCLFFSGDTLLFQNMVNCRTSTNEIDLLVSWSDIAIQNNINQIFDYMGKSFLCECKNYQDGVGVTYIGKFFSLLKVNDCKFGIIFTSTRIKGKGKWDSAKGLIRKIALRDYTYIIDINWDDLTEIYNGQSNILNLIKNKYNELKNDVDYEKYVQKHEMEDEILNMTKCYNKTS